MRLERFSMGIGDRFARQGRAQLQALMRVRDAGVTVVPVWNKSHREHGIVGSAPADVRREADAAVQELGWTGAYYVDADHIGMKNVDLFMEASDFYTLDVADFTGKPADPAAVDAFVKCMTDYARPLDIPGIDQPLDITPARIRAIAEKYLLAVQEAGRIYRHIESARGAGLFVTEVSMDETDQPQTPVDLLFILAAIAQEGIPAQTIAPKFTGRFNKGVDYVGDVAQFAREFEDDVCVIAFAVKAFGLPDNLKLSVHSGSDKFSLYGPIRDIVGRHGAGLHLKTAGTTWLEEIIGLAEAGGEGLAIAQEVYRRARERFDELCAPYATVIDIRTDRLPDPAAVAGWSGEQLVRALRHDQTCPEFNPDMRQLLHVGYKIAAEMGARYLDTLDACEDAIARNVVANIFERHAQRLFLPEAP